VSSAVIFSVSLVSVVAVVVIGGVEECIYNRYSFDSSCFLVE
jgi:hypothetical protein